MEIISAKITSVFETGAVKAKANAVLGRFGVRGIKVCETAFFLLRPTCISVLPEDALAARVGALVTLFKSQPELEILCLNSRESFANNTRYLEARIGEEENPYIADLLEKDKAHLGSVQLQTATAREFVLAVRLEAVREKEKYTRPVSCTGRDTFCRGMTPAQKCFLKGPQSRKIILRNTRSESCTRMRRRRSSTKRQPRTGLNVPRSMGTDLPNTGLRNVTLREKAVLWMQNPRHGFLPKRRRRLTYLCADS